MFRAITLAAVATLALSTASLGGVDKVNAVLLDKKVRTSADEITDALKEEGLEALPEDKAKAIAEHFDSCGTKSIMAIKQGDVYQVADNDNPNNAYSFTMDGDAFEEKNKKCANDDDDDKE